MHLIKGIEDRKFFPFYRKRRVLARPDSLPSIFRKLRIDSNLTSRGLAKRFSLSEEYVRAVESGSEFPSLRYCLKCGELFGANPSWVKTKWAREAIERYRDRLMKRLGLDR